MHCSSHIELLFNRSYIFPLQTWLTLEQKDKFSSFVLFVKENYEDTKYKKPSIFTIKHPQLDLRGSRLFTLTGVYNI